jgi:hypothetical protein
MKINSIVVYALIYFALFHFENTADFIAVNLQQKIKRSNQKRRVNHFFSEKSRSRKRVSHRRFLESFKKARFFNFQIVFCQLFEQQVRKN